MGTHRRGFTLFELLAVIAIIAVLASLLLPAAARVRDSAKLTVCQMQMRQAGLAFLAYAGDNEDLVPWVKDQSADYARNILWTARISPYVDDPQRTAGGEQGVLTGCTVYRTAANSGLYGYAMNQVLERPAGWRTNWVNDAWQPYGSTGFREFRMGTLSYAGNRALLADWEDQHMGTVSTATVGWRHRDRASVVFVDLHADAVRKGPPGSEIADAYRVRDRPDLGYFR